MSDLTVVNQGHKKEASVLIVYAGEAATNALKLYDGGLGLKFKPTGEKSTVVMPSLTMSDETLQLVVNGSLSKTLPTNVNQQDKFSSAFVIKIKP